MTNHKHQRIIQTNHGNFCQDCGVLQVDLTPKKIKKPDYSQHVGIAKIWER